VLKFKTKFRRQRVKAALTPVSGYSENETILIRYEDRYVCKSAGILSFLTEGGVDWNFTPIGKTKVFVEKTSWKGSFAAAFGYIIFKFEFRKQIHCRF
jgi:hypothetical protein